MPLFELQTNLPASSIPEDYHEQLTDCLAALLGKPKKVIKTEPQNTLCWSFILQQIYIICDFIAGMTDRYAVNLFEKLFVPRPWAVF